MYFKNVFLHFRDKVSELYSKDPNIDAFVYITFRDGELGIMGMGYLGKTCAEPQMRSSIVDWFYYDVPTGTVRQLMLYFPRVLV